MFEALYVALFFTLTIPLLAWGLHGLWLDCKYYATYHTEDNHPVE